MFLSSRAGIFPKVWIGDIVYSSKTNENIFMVVVNNLVKIVVFIGWLAQNYAYTWCTKNYLSVIRDIGTLILHLQQKSKVTISSSNKKRASNWDDIVKEKAHFSEVFAYKIFSNKPENMRASLNRRLYMGFFDLNSESSKYRIFSQF